MNGYALRKIVLGACMIAFVGLVSAQAQGPGGPPHGGGPGGPGGPGGMGPGGMGPGAGPGGPENSGNLGGAGNSGRPGFRSENGSPRSSQQFGPVGRWWDDKSVVKSIGLRKDQQKTMDKIFDANRQAILGSYNAFLREQAKLEKLNKDPKSDQASIFAAIDSVSKARTVLQKTTAQMLLQIRQQMDPGQIENLEKLP